MKDITESAVKFQAQTAQLTGALKNMGEFSQKNVARVTDAADTLATHGGYDPQTSLAGMTRLIDAHASVAKAIKDETLVTDIARRSGLSYQTALRAVIQVEQGRTTGLSRLGIVLPKVTTAMDALTKAHTTQTLAQKLHVIAQEQAIRNNTLLTASEKSQELAALHTQQMIQASHASTATTAQKAAAKAKDAAATSAAAMTELWHRFSGATAQYSKTAAGAATNFKQSIEILGQRLGTVLLPVIVSVVHALTAVATWLINNKTATHVLLGVLGALVAIWAANKLADFVKWLKESVVVTKLLSLATREQGVATEVAAGQMALLDTAEGGATVASGLLATAMYAIPILAVIGLVILLVTHFHTVISVVKDVAKWIASAFMSIVHAVGDAIGWIGKHWPLLLAILTGPIGLAIYFIVKHFNDIKTVVGGVVKFIVHILSTVAGAIGSAMNSLWNILTWPFREAIKFVHLLLNAIGTVLSPIKTIGHIAGGLIGDVGGAIGSVLGLAGGGDVTRGGMFDVGERGRERVYLPAGTAVRPVAAAAGGGLDGAPMVENHVTIQIGPNQFMKAMVYTQSIAKALR